MNLKSKIGLGSVQFGLDYGISNQKGKTTKDEVVKIINYAHSEGIDLIDTAIAYGDSEKVLGEIGVEKFKVVSKFLPEFEIGLSIQEQLEKSLTMLNMESLYAYIAHRPNDILDNPYKWKEVKNLKELGLVKKIGYSLNKPDELNGLLKKDMRPDIVQVPFNYLDRRFEYLIEGLHTDGVEIHSRSTFLQGLFFRDPYSLPTYFDEIKDILQHLIDTNKNLANSLLRFVLERPFIDKVIVGAENVRQLKENIEGLEKTASLSNNKYEISDSILIPSNWP